MKIYAVAIPVLAVAAGLTFAGIYERPNNPVAASELPASTDERNKVLGIAFAILYDAKCAKLPVIFMAITHETSRRLPSAMRSQSTALVHETYTRVGHTQWCNTTAPIIERSLSSNGLGDIPRPRL